MELADFMTTLERRAEPPVTQPHADGLAVFGKAVPAALTSRPPLPGEVWTIGDFESHCLAIALDRLRPFLDNDERELAVWQTTLVGDVQITPFDTDRVLFEFLVGSEAAHLWQLGNELLPCGHRADEHITCLRGWARREIVAPKRFAASRRLLADLAPEDRLFGKRRFARADVEALIETETARLHDELKIEPALRGEHDDELDLLLDEARRRLLDAYEPLIID
jgi:hypothetical protein